MSPSVAFFVQATETIWSPEARADLRDDDLVVLIPAFVSSELTRAFEIGFLLYIPFLVVDLLVSNVLMAMGMSMVSPNLISIPLKIFIRVAEWLVALDARFDFELRLRHDPWARMFSCH